MHDFRNWQWQWGRSTVPTQACQEIKSGGLTVHCNLLGKADALKLIVQYSTNSCPAGRTTSLRYQPTLLEELLQQLSTLRLVFAFTLETTTELIPQPQDDHLEE